MHKAIVLAGGRGSRLWPLTLTRPKPLVPVVNRPVLVHLLEWLRSHGITDVLVTVHYRSDEISRVFGDGRAFGLRISYQLEKEPLGTAGAVKQAEEWVGNDPFVIASGDALTDLDLGGLIRRHRESGAWMTLGLRPVKEPSPYGVAQLDDWGRVLRFQEKPVPGQAISRLANTGICCVDPAVLARVPSGQACDWSRDVFPVMLSEGLPLAGHPMNGYWRDIGSIRDYRRSQKDALEGAVRVTLPGVPVCPGIWLGPNVRIDPGAAIEGPVLLGAGCRVERDALVLPGAVLGERCVVRRGACVWNAVVGDDVEIGAGAVARHCVIGEEVRVGAGCSVFEGAVVARGARLIRGARLGAEQRVEPDQVIAGSEPVVPLSLARRAESGRLLAPIQARG